MRAIDFQTQVDKYLAVFDIQAKNGDYYTALDLLVADVVKEEAAARHAVEAEVKRLRERVAELEDFLDDCPYCSYQRGKDEGTDK